MSDLVSDERGLVSSCPQCGQRNRLGYERLGQQFRCGQCRHELGQPAEPVEIASEGIFDSLINYSALPVLVDFWAPWCGPCRMVAPELVKVAADGAGRWLVAKVNTDELAGPAQRHQIQAIPTMILFQRGRAVARQSGAAMAAAIRRFIEQSEFASK